MKAPSLLPYILAIPVFFLGPLILLSENIASGIPEPATKFFVGFVLIYIVWTIRLATLVMRYRFDTTVITRNFVAEIRAVKDKVAEELHFMNNDIPITNEEYFRFVSENIGSHIATLESEVLTIITRCEGNLRALLKEYTNNKTQRTAQEAIEFMQSYINDLEKTAPYRRGASLFERLRNIKYYRK